MAGDVSAASVLSGGWPLVGREQELDAIASTRTTMGCCGTVVVARR
jgi:hypothetical protein